MKTKRCKQFCKTYVNQMSNKFKSLSKKYKTPYRPPTKKEHEYDLKVCKKTHCNETCKGFDFSGDITKQTNFLKQFKHGFPTSYTTSKIDSLKQKGALSSCILE